MLVSFNPARLSVQAQRAEDRKTPCADKICKKGFVLSALPSFLFPPDKAILKHYVPPVACGL